MFPLGCAGLVRRIVWRAKLAVLADNGGTVSPPRVHTVQQGVLHRAATEPGKLLVYKTKNVISRILAAAACTRRGPSFWKHA